MRFAAVLRTFAHLSPALLRATHLGFAAMSHADMAGTASLVPAMSRRSPYAHKKDIPERMQASVRNVFFVSAWLIATRIISY